MFGTLVILDSAIKDVLFAFLYHSIDFISHYFIFFHFPWLMKFISFMDCRYYFVCQPRRFMYVFHLIVVVGAAHEYKWIKNHK